MKNSAIVKAVSRSVHKVGFKFKKHSPEILLATGIVGTVASTVMACKATTKISEIMDETKETVDAIHECVENPEMADKYTVEDSKKDLAITYVQTGVKLVKLYGPSILLGTASIGCILASYNIIHKRNVALSAYAAAVSNSFKDYRQRVVDRFGEEMDRELKYNIKALEIEEEVVDENGEIVTVKKTVQNVNSADASEFARFFDDTALGWTRDAEYNHTFLVQQQAYFNNKLQTKGYVFLNDVYKALGLQVSKAGQIVGWVYRPNDPDWKGDNYIDFNIHNLYDEQKRLFVNGHEKSILLDFNVDGNILEYI
jgi:hypothetical protein